MSTPDEYPEDEFDAEGRDRSPQGVHRGARPLWRTLLPILAVIIIAPLLAWGGVELLGRTTPPETTAAPTETQTTEATDEPTDEPTTEEPTTEEPTEEETTTEAPEIDYDTTITVLNGTGVTGLAGDTVDQLAAEGYTDLVAEDYGYASPTTTTLYYENAELQATAEDVASVLGIGNVVESSEATVSIAIVLRSDFVG